MQDKSKTKAKLVEELEAARRRIAALERRAESGRAAGETAVAASPSPRAIEEHRPMLRSILDNASTVIYVKDLAGRYLLINRRYEELFRVTNEEIVGKTDYDVFPPEAAAQFQEQDRRTASAGEPIESEEQVPQADGMHTYISVKFPLRDAEGRTYATGGISTDITERKRVERQLRESRELLEERVRERTLEIRDEQSFTDAALNSLPGLFYVFDAEGALKRWNSRLAEVTGYSEEEIAQRHATEYFAAEDVPRVIEATTEAFREGETSVEASVITKDGRRIPYLFHGVRARIGDETYMVGMGIDVTERKRAQEALRESEERYRTIFETAGTGMISFGEDSVITLANDEWASVSGYSKEETIGKLSWMPFFTEQSLVKMRKYHALRSKDPASVPRAYEAQFIDRQGRIHDGIINIQLVPGTQQRVASFQDLTALKRAQQEMYRADKMAALGQIIAGVAHEINNPNNFIYFNLPILRRYLEAITPLLRHHLDRDPGLRILGMPYETFLQDVYKLLENMEHGSQRITGIVSELRHYVRGDDDAERKEGMISEVIDRVMTLVGKQVRKMVKRFDVQVGDGLEPVRMDAGKIEQVLINLVINAGQAADKHDSWVKLSARSVRDDRAWVEIAVEDNGGGIPEENLEQIFEPFFTSKGREQGTGLGLSISQRIVEEHGGTIRVRSTVGEGSTFTIRLPAADAS